MPVSTEHPRGCLRIYSGKVRNPKRTFLNGGKITQPIIGGVGMETVCQACGYQRKPTDQAPDWECPSCGKAYIKTSHESPGALSGYARRPPSDLRTNNTPTRWSVASLILGIACVPFVLAWLWLMIDTTRMTSHPVPPDRVIPERMKGGRIVYATAAEQKRQHEAAEFLIFPGSLVLIAFVIARGRAKRAQDE
jgi:predicted RNA-binding Zn-ribbon protein involved in translation (DUF1610 family)